MISKTIKRLRRENVSLKWILMRASPTPMPILESLSSKSSFSFSLTFTHCLFSPRWSHNSLQRSGRRKDKSKLHLVWSAGRKPSTLLTLLLWGGFGWRARGKDASDKNQPRWMGEAAIVHVCWRVSRWANAISPLWNVTKKAKVITQVHLSVSLLQLLLCAAMRWQGIYCWGWLLVAL